MADPKKRLQTNIPGEFFVDSTCINCDTCRQIAPSVFGEAAGYSHVKQQPGEQSEIRSATRALLACPTGSIGTSGKNCAKEVTSDFPLQIEDEVFYCGFNSPKSYGGNSYFIQKPNGNWLIDAPKFLPQLVSRIEELGGLAYIFLTHRDDVADAQQYAEKFGAKCIIHRDDLSAYRNADIVIEGADDQPFNDEFTFVPTPGHTAGHCALLYRNKFLFTGDHMAWDRENGMLEAWPDVCWWSWDEQKKSIERLTKLSFEWVIPGHGQRVHLPSDQMQIKLHELIESLP